MDAKKRVLVTFKSKLYDITDFMHKHPGGVNTLKGLENKDMEARFYSGPPHSNAAMYLLQEYQVNTVDDNENEMQTRNEKISEKITEADTKEDSLETKKNGTDESMEYLVDWNKPMLRQIPSLKKNYTEWVNKPVDRPLRLFKSTWMEVLSKNPWWVVPIFWLPIIYLLIWFGGANEPNSKAISKTTLYLSNMSIGVGLWTVLEYSLHRWVFHMNTNTGNRFVITFNFIIHGLHHKVPFDQYRLVFPPVPAVIIASIIYQPVWILFAFPRLVLAGGLVGYLVYDMTHYYIHHGSPANGYLYSIKRYHYQHHFVHHDKGFGISSPFWDNIFGTKILLRKLKYILKW